MKDTAIENIYLVRDEILHMKIIIKIKFGEPIFVFPA